MNRNNKLLLGALAFVVACTIGYALFSESINITGTASAEGNFELTTTCQAGLANGITMNNKEGAYANDSCSVVGNTVTFKTDLLYPTARRYFTVKITNTGSIPAVFNGSKTVAEVTSYNEDNSVYKHGIITDEDFVCTSTTSSEGDFSSNDFMNQGEAVLLSEGINDYTIDEVFNNEELVKDFSTSIDCNGETNYIPVLKTGYSVFYVFEAKWPDTSYTLTKNGYVIANSSTTLRFKQPSE